MKMKREDEEGRRDQRAKTKEKLLDSLKASVSPTEGLRLFIAGHWHYSILILILIYTCILSGVSFEGFSSRNLLVHHQF